MYYNNNTPSEYVIMINPNITNNNSNGNNTKNHETSL